MLERCSYGAVFSARPGGLTVLRKLRALPRPYLFRMDPIRRDRFTLLLVGNAAPLLPRIAAIFDRLGRKGLTPGGPPAEIESIEVIEPESTVPYDGGLAPPPHPLDEWIGEYPVTRTVRMVFLTPTEIRAQGRIIRDAAPGPVIRRIRDRLAALSAAWCGGPPDWDYQAIGEFADRILLRDPKLRWVGQSRRSGTSGHRYPSSGFSGSVTWDFVAPELLPLLLAGQMLGVGRHCSFGNGWYEARGVIGDTPIAPRTKRIPSGGAPL